MCGIAGIHRLRGRIDVGRLARMGALLRHRGPHDEGLVLIESDGARTFGGLDTPRDTYASRHPYAPGRRHGGPGNGEILVGLAHRRLSIVDLSPGGHQPMCDASTRLWITYNGEIYNHVELRAELAALGHTFTSQSDTEVLLAAWRQWGEDSLPRLNGMFALALWDMDRRTLFCARDRFGVKPFVYQWDGNTFVFASEPKALVLTQATPPRPRLEAIRDLIALDWVDHATTTFFAGVDSLPPGHALTVGPGGLAVRRWWALDPERRATGSPASWTGEFAERFADAVRLRLRADVEVGSCLSGGLDSSAVVTTAARLASRPLHTFTVAYDEGPAWDERPYVAATVAASGAHSHVVVPDGADFWEVFDRLAFQQDEPTAGPGVWSQWKVMERAHAEGLIVLLDGQGGDETLAGYERYLPLRLRDHLAAGNFGGALSLWGRVAARLGAAHTLALVAEPWVPQSLFAPLRRAFGQGKDRVLAPGLRGLEGAPPPRPPGAFRSAVLRQQAFDLLQRLLPSLLRYEDRSSMAFSIETRLPFLDYRLVEFVFSLPDDERLSGPTTKAILRRAFSDRLPPSVLARRDKMGFETPADLWLRGRFAGEVRRRLLEPGPLHQWLEPTALRAELERFLGGERGIGLQVWRWLSLASWARSYLGVDPRVVESAPRAYAHPGLHLSYADLERERARDGAAA